MAENLRHRLALAVGAIACVAVAGAAVGMALGAPASPESLREGNVSDVIPVGDREFDDKRTVELSLTRGATVSITAPASGRITTFTCASDVALVSGQPALAIDGVAIVALGTATPLWRDLVIGDRGADARAFQEELARLGYDVAVDGVIGAHTVTAAHELLSSHGVDVRRLEGIPQAAFLWIPSATVSIAECERSIGQQVGAGDVIATLAEGLRSAQVTRMPPDLVPGARMLLVDGAKIAVDEAGKVVDAEALAQLATSPSYAIAQRTKEKGFGASLVLATALTVAVVPPQSLYAIEGAQACVASGNRSYEVAVVGSELGQSFVQFADVPPSEVLLDPRGLASCR